MNEEYIDFEKEIQEFIIKKYVQKIETLEKKHHYCIFQLITLENDQFIIKCSVSEGIQIMDSSLPKLEKIVFESFEQLLGIYSKLYVQTYSNELYARLQQISAGQT